MFCMVEPTAAGRSKGVFGIHSLQTVARGVAVFHVEAEVVRRQGRGRASRGTSVRRPLRMKREITHTIMCRSVVVSTRTSRLHVNDAR